MAKHALSVSEVCVFKHSGSSYGENIAAGYASATKALDAWYDENTQYSYEKGEYTVCLLSHFFCFLELTVLVGSYWPLYPDGLEECQESRMRHVHLQQQKWYSWRFYHLQLRHWFVLSSPFPVGVMVLSDTA